MDNSYQNLKPLPVLKIVFSSFLIPWQRRVIMVKALALTAFTLALFDYVLVAFPGINTLLNIIIWTAKGYVFIIFAVACHRIILIGAGSISTHVFFKWTSRETKFLGWTILVYLYLKAIMTFTVSPVLFFAPSPEWVENDRIRLMLLILSLPGFYVFSRLSILLPAAAVDERPRLSWAWNLTKGNGWRLLILICILPIVITYGREFIIFDDSALFFFLMYIIGYSLVVVEIALLSISFKFLQAQASSTVENQFVGWAPGLCPTNCSEADHGNMPDAL